MVFNFFSNLRNSKGITLVEIVVVVFVIGIFSLMMTANFPGILRQLALSKTTYKLVQDFRRVQDLGLSGVQINDGQGQSIKAIKGYGIYVNLDNRNLDNKATHYVIYADTDNNNEYNGFDNPPDCNSGAGIDLSNDCFIEKVNVSEENSSVYIKGFRNIDGAYTSVNFRPPNPILDIKNLLSSETKVGIVLGLTTDDTAERIIWVSTAGLISVN